MSWRAEVPSSVLKSTAGVSLTAASAAAGLAVDRTAATLWCPCLGSAGLRLPGHYVHSSISGGDAPRAFRGTAGAAGGARGQHRVPLPYWAGDGAGHRVSHHGDFPAPEEHAAAKWCHLPHWDISRPPRKAAGPSPPALSPLPEAETGLRQMQ